MTLPPHPPSSNSGTNNRTLHARVRPCGMAGPPATPVRGGTNRPGPAAAHVGKIGGAFCRRGCGHSVVWHHIGLPSL